MNKEIADHLNVPKDLVMSDGEHIRSIKFLMAANFPVNYITSWEEDRVEEAIKQISQEAGKRVICWSCTSGFTQNGRRLPQSTTDPLLALDYILQEGEATSFIFSKRLLYQGM